MPITKSAEKALRQSKKRHVRNVQKKNAYKNAFKAYQKVATSGSASEANKMLAQVFKAVDKAAKTGVIKKNKAARLKSKAARVLKKTA